MKPLHFLVSGYYGMDNAGDELIVSSLVLSLKTYFPGCIITVLSGNPTRTAAQLAVRSVYRKNPFNLIKALIFCDVLITGGGGLFQDTTGHFSLYYYAGIMLWAYMLKKKTILYAVEISPVKSRLHRLLIRYLFNRSDILSVRNDESRKLIELYGCKRDDAFMLSDPVLVSESARALFSSFNSKKSLLAAGIVIRRISQYSGDHERFLSVYVDLLAACREQNIQPYIIPFHKKEDVKFAALLKEKSKIDIPLYMWESPEELVTLFKNLSVVISSRLHGLILAMSLGVPSIGIIPEDDADGGKVKRFVAWSGNEMSYPQNTVTAEVLIEALKKIRAVDRDVVIRSSKEKMVHLFEQHDLFWQKLTKKLEH